MARHLIQVGAGDYWGLVEKSIAPLKAAGLIDGVTTVDIKSQAPSEHPHVQRQADEPLSAIVDRLGHVAPFVILAHPNELHVPEAVELMANSRSSPKLLIEKPYAITQDQLARLDDLVHEAEGDVGFLEYYLLMKGMPLLVFGGVVKENSFYFEDNGILKVRKDGAVLSDFSGKLEEAIGDPLHVASDIIEGAGSFGTVAHRDISLIDTEKGGGMIQDLGHHATTPLIALGDYLGKISVGSLRDVRVGTCDEYAKAAKERGLPRDRIGESYAEMDLETSTGVPIRVSIGKYVEAGENQRRITITGTRGVVVYNMTFNVLNFQHGDDDVAVKLVEADKSGVPKYLAALRAGMETLEGRNPFNFDHNQVALQAQRLVLKALEKKPSESTTYKQGTMHDRIFRN